MDDPWIVLAATVVIIAASAFFVAIEFALIAAKRHRLEEVAAESRAGRAALRSASELSVLLAGSQLGITLCVLALGAITKPAVHHWLTPAFEDLGLPYWSADVVGFVLALVIVTFLHLVVGEMAPKSWAIAHPERSATLLALPMRGFMWVTRPLLHLLNNLANWILRRVGVDAVDSLSAGQNPDDLRALVKHSSSVGVLDESFSEQLSGALDLGRLTLADVVRPSVPVAVDADATISQVQRASHESGHLRILVRTGDETMDVVHVRDTMTLPGSTPVTGLLRDCHVLDSGMTVLEALATMRETSTQLSMVRRESGDLGVVTIADMLQGLVPSGSNGATVGP
ncbi:hemolysin family protein [Aeromicrobium sp. Leaf350]|uniref:hemolysin family protein n=1 Tax=Aeromicrobium sp. Leaf350 TaxID=2876565 RepID=UPI001E2E4ACC|nr:hemolysin family protein [Aeromicrobium sp. Leaf350]